MNSPCPTCEGRRQFAVGYYSDGTEAWVNCPTCEGKGAVETKEHNGSQQEDS